MILIIVILGFSGRYMIPNGYYWKSLERYRAQNAFTVVRI